MPVAATTDKEFIELFESKGPAQMSRDLDLPVRGIFARRVRLEKKLEIKIRSPEEHRSVVSADIQGRLHFPIKDGVVIVGSDAHYWPNYITPAHKAFVRFCKELKPKAIIANGDFLDGATISRHASIGWEYKPTLIGEIEACQERLAEVEAAAPNAKKFWTLGNHDSRFETRLASVTPEYARTHGFSLSDHFPEWEPCWSVWVGKDVVVKHRWKGGVHATHNNTAQSGKTMVTGHLHSLKVTPYSDYTGTRFGVDTGTLADAYGVQFNNYLEDSPRNWRSGFVVLTWQDGRLLWPEIVHVIDSEKQLVEFRGEIIDVS